MEKILPQPTLRIGNHYWYSAEVKKAEAKLCFLQGSSKLMRYAFGICSTLSIFAMQLERKEEVERPTAPPILHGFFYIYAKRVQLYLSTFNGTEFEIISSVF